MGVSARGLDDRAGAGGHRGRAALAGVIAGAAEREDDGEAAAAVAAVAALADRRNADGVVAVGLDRAGREIGEGRAGEPGQAAVAVAADAIGGAAVAAVAAIAERRDARRPGPEGLDDRVGGQGDVAAVDPVAAVAGVARDVAVAAAAPVIARGLRGDPHRSGGYPRGDGEWSGVHRQAEGGSP